MLIIVRVAFVKAVGEIIKNLTEDEVASLWAFSVKKWQATIRDGRV